MSDIKQVGMDSQATGVKSHQKIISSSGDHSHGVGLNGFVLSLMTMFIGAFIAVVKTILAKAGMATLSENFGVLSNKGDASFVDKWIRDLYKNSDNFMINFDLINEYREFRFPKEKYPGAWIPVPPNLERGFLLNGKLIDGETDKTFLFSALHMNPSLLASAYRATTNQAIAVGVLMSLSISGLLYWMLGDLIQLNYTSTESWGSYGSEHFFSIKNLMLSGPVSVIASAIIAAPLLFVLRIARAEHDVIAFNEAYADIERQIKHYRGDEAAREALTISALESANVHVFSEIRAEQLNNFWRVQKSGQPLIESFVDDGTSRERGMVHGLEAGTKILISSEEKCTNTLSTGEIGSGKTTRVALRDLKNYLKAMVKYGRPIQGLGGDGKASLQHKMKRMLRAINFPQENFIDIGIGEGTFGCPVFHGMSPDALIGIIKNSQPTLKDDFFTKQARAQIRVSIVIGKAYHQTEMGAQYELDTNGETTDSPVFAQRLCNDPEFLYKTISELTEYFKANERARKALYTKELKLAFRRCLTSWKRYMASDEMVNGIIASVDTYLNPLTQNGDICDRFGSGRFGNEYKDPSLMLNGYFFFMTISTADQPEAARLLNGILSARLYNALMLRGVEFEKNGIPGWSSSVYGIMDEHHLLVSGGVDGLSDASVFNISRSLGLCFTGMTQSTDAYIMSLGEVQTENMTQNMLTRVMLPTTSKRDQDYIASTFGTRNKMNVDNGVFATEGARELKNGGVITIPRTEIRKVTVISPMGMPEALSKASQDLIDDLEKSEPAVYLPGSVRPYSLKTGHTFLDLIGSPITMKRHRESRVRFSVTGLFGGHDSRPLLSLIDGEGEDSPEASKAEISLEQKARFDGIQQVPLFTQDDFINAGTSYAIIRMPHYGLDYALRSKLDGIYI